MACVSSPAMICGRNVRLAKSSFGNKGLGEGLALSAHPCGKASSRRRGIRGAAFAKNGFVKNMDGEDSKNTSKGTADKEPPLPIIELKSPPTPSVKNAQKSSTGLLRATLTGGVQSATDSHDLPSPAVAVRNLVEQGRHAHLCTTMSRMHHRRAGYPFGSMVDFATDNNGFPIFSLSPLAIQTRNLMANPHCSMVVQMPGWGGLANARVTIFGDVYPVPPETQPLAREIFGAKHTSASHSQQWGNFAFFRMDNITDIYFVGGFGTVQWVEILDYVTQRPDKIVCRTATNCPEEVLLKLNQMYSKRLCEMLSTSALQKSEAVEDCQLVSIDKQGVDIRIRQSGMLENQMIRLRFKNHVFDLEQAIKEMEGITAGALYL